MQKHTWNQNYGCENVIETEKPCQERQYYRFHFGFRQKSLDTYQKKKRKSDVKTVCNARTNGELVKIQDRVYRKKIVSDKVVNTTFLAAISKSRLVTIQNKFCKFL